MIIRPRPNLLQLFFVVRGSIVMLVMPRLLFVAGLSALVVWTHQVKPGFLPNFDGAPFALLGIALSVFLAFRNNACYDRWWEARRHWGELIAASRNFARQTIIFKEGDKEQKERRKQLLTWTIAYAQSLVVHLRPNGDFAKVSKHLEPQLLEHYLSSRNPPEVILEAMQNNIVKSRTQGVIGDIPYQMLDHTISQMSAVQAACERILTTPIPFGYTLLLHRTAYTFCFLMPFGFADTLGWATPFATALAAYTFFGLDALGNELEDPFGILPNDLAIGALADTIEINMLEALGETPLPPLPTPANYILM